MDTPTSDIPSASLASAAPSTNKKGSWGGLIGILLIVLAIILGAFYSWGERMALDEARNLEPIE